MVFKTTDKNRGKTKGSPSTAGNNSWQVKDLSLKLNAVVVVTANVGHVAMEKKNAMSFIKDFKGSGCVDSALSDDCVCGHRGHLKILQFIVKGSLWLVLPANDPPYKATVTIDGEKREQVKWSS